MTPKCKAIYTDRRSSNWLKTALTFALGRNPANAAADAEALAMALQEWCDTVMRENGEDKSFNSVVGDE